MFNNIESFNNFYNSLPDIEKSGRSIHEWVMKLVQSETHTIDGENFFIAPNLLEGNRAEFTNSYLEFIKKNKPKNIFCYLPTECQTPLIQEFFSDYFQNSKQDRISNLNSRLEEYDCTLYYIIGSHNVELYNTFFDETKINRIQIIYWPTYLITHTFTLLFHGLLHKSEKASLDLNKNFEKLFINYNNRPRIHRKIMMDLLVKNNLFSSGRNSWNNLSKDVLGTDIISQFEYETKYWNESLINLDEYNSKNKNYKEEHSDTMLNPNTLFSLVGETSMDVPYVTEKTYRCFFFKQPFIAYGAKGQNKEIIKYGFKIFDNIIDYSFDDESNYMKRFQGLIEQLKKLNNLDYNELYEKMNSVLEHNEKRVYDLLTKDELVPKELLKLYENRN